MQKLLRYNQIRIICYLIAVSLWLMPMAHATSMMLNADVKLAAENSQPCHQSAVVVETTNAQSHTMSHAPTSLDDDCNHSGTCQLLCSSAIPTLPTMAVTTLGQQSSHVWIRQNSSTLTPSFLTSLDKPPRL